MAQQAAKAGADIVFQAPYQGAKRIRNGWDLGEQGRCRFLVGADGTNSRLAQSLNLGRNTSKLHGIEQEYRIGQQVPLLEEPDALHFCTITCRVTGCST